jgi:hypothetical protein
MMPEDPKPFIIPPSPGPSPAPAPTAPAVASSAEAPAAPPLSPAVERFKSCRWRAQPEDGQFCTHRDVLPMAGREGFNPEAWCPDCSFFKVRRAPRKRPEY